jgi:fimbrial chaperone protein
VEYCSHCWCYFIRQFGQAGVVLGGTRVIYPADQAEVQISLKNKDNDERYLVQSWVSNVDDSKAPSLLRLRFIS